MAAEILGISGSPVVESNTDRAMREILDHTGLEYRFIKLSNYHIEPCRACLGCTEDNICTIHDNGQVLAEQFAEARGFVIGGYSSYGSLDSRTKTFMERMYCLRHLRSRNKGKFGVCVIASEAGTGEVDLLQRQFDLWMQAEGMIHLGTLVVPGDNTCIRCGNTMQCVGKPGQNQQLSPEFLVGEIRIEPTVMTRAAELGAKLRESLHAASAEQPANT